MVGGQIIETTRPMSAALSFAALAVATSRSEGFPSNEQQEEPEVSTQQSALNERKEALEREILSIKDQIDAKQHEIEETKE